MSSCLVSIIIPCYNAEAYIGDAISSALAQTYPSTEVIVVDDGSTDGSLGVIRSFGERVRWETGPRRGAPHARNRGLHLARGLWVQFLDADDLLAPTKIAMQMAVAETDSCDLVFCDGEAIDAVTGHRVGAYADRFIPSDPVVHVLLHRLLVLAPLHRKDMLESVGGFTEGLPCSQERDLHLRLACEGYRFQHLPETLFTVRRVQGSISSNYARALKQHGPMFRSACSTLLRSGSLTEARRLAFAETLARDARHLIREGCFSDAGAYFAEACHLHPSGGLRRFGWAYRVAHRLLGPLSAERLAAWKTRRGEVPAQKAASSEAPPSTPWESEWIDDDFEKDLVSVVMPVHNARPWVAAALDSVARQTYRPIELVIADDGSTDGSGTAVDEWCSRHAEEQEFTARVLHLEHRGGCAALNRALPLTRGEFIQYLDADDLLDPNKITVHVRALKADPSLEFVYGVAYTFTDEPVASGQPNYGGIQRIGVADVCRESQWSVNDSLTRRGLVKRVGPWNENLARRRDWEYSLRAMLEAQAFRGCPEGVSFYRHGHQPVRERDYLLRSEQNAILAYRSMWSHLEAHNATSRPVRDAMARNAFRSAFALAQLHFTSDAESIATWGLGCKPALRWRVLLRSFRASLHMVGGTLTLRWVRWLVAARPRGAHKNRGVQVCTK